MKKLFNDLILSILPINGLKFIKQYYSIKENIFISIKIFIYSVILMLIDCIFCEGFLVEILKEEFLTIVFGFIAVAVALFGIIAPLFLSIYLKFTFDFKREMNFSTLIKALNESLSEAVLMIIGFFISFLILESNFSGFEYSNNIISIFLIFFLLSMCQIIYGLLLLINKISLGLISILSEK